MKLVVFAFKTVVLQNYLLFTHFYGTNFFCIVAIYVHTCKAHGMIVVVHCIVQKDSIWFPVKESLMCYLNYVFIIALENTLQKILSNTVIYILYQSYVMFYIPAFILFITKHFQHEIHILNSRTCQVHTGDTFLKSHICIETLCLTF